MKDILNKLSALEGKKQLNESLDDMGNSLGEASARKTYNLQVIEYAKIDPRTHEATADGYMYDTQTEEEIPVELEIDYTPPSDDSDAGPGEDLWADITKITDENGFEIPLEDVSYDTDTLNAAIYDALSENNMPYEESKRNTKPALTEAQIEIDELTLSKVMTDWATGKLGNSGITSDYAPMNPSDIDSMSAEPSMDEPDMSADPMGMSEPMDVIPAPEVEPMATDTEEIVDEAILTEGLEQIVTDILTGVGLDHGYDFFFENGLIIVGRDTAKVALNALKSSPEISANPYIANIDGEEVRVSFGNKPEAPKPDEDDINRLAATSDIYDSKQPTKRPINESALRLVFRKSNEATGKSIKVYRDNEWQEYVVRFYQNGQHQPDADFHTDDKDDAISTGTHWVEGARDMNSMSFEGKDSDKEPIRSADREDDDDDTNWEEEDDLSESTKVNEDVSMNISAVGEQDMVTLIQRLAGIQSLGMNASVAPAAPAPVATVSAVEVPPPASTCNSIDIVADEAAEPEYANSPDEEVAGLDAAIPTGDDLAGGTGKSYPQVAGGSNPMAPAHESTELHEEGSDDQYACVYCGKDVPSGIEPSMHDCCGERGHVEKVERDDVDEADDRFLESLRNIR